MDSGTMSGIMTAFLFALFLGIWFWAWGKKQKSRFDEASNLPFNDEIQPHETKKEERK